MDITMLRDTDSDSSSIFHGGGFGVKNYYRNRSFGVISMRIGGVLFTLFSLLLLPGVLLQWYDFLVSSPTALSPNTLRSGTIVLLVSLIGGLLLTNLYPDVATNDDGLYVKFYFAWLFVPWEDLISISPSFISSVLASRPHQLVRVRRLTVIHLLVSLNQLGGFGPGFLISPKIDDYQDLIHAIKEHLPQSRVEQ
jgi:hypothetical protein